MRDTASNVGCPFKVHIDTNPDYSDLEKDLRKAGRYKLKLNFHSSGNQTMILYDFIVL